jgi:hypothetical protein
MIYTHTYIYTKQKQDLSIVDKITLSTTRFFLASKTARSAVFFYVVGLHFLVFVTLYFVGHHHCADLHYHGEAMSIPPDGMSLGGVPPLDAGGR